MKKTLLITFCMLLSLNMQAADFETAKDAVKNMGMGWNLGNTLDAVNWNGGDGWNWSSPADHEKGWGQPITKPELMKMMKEAGFGAIRVPVTWAQEMDKDGKVNAAWMKRVHEVVDYVIDNGMYCLLNVHHDTGENSWIKADGNNYKQNKDRFEGLWKQIATEFKDYDQHLLFESYNEMLDANNQWNEPKDAKDGYAAVNNYAKSFVTAVRATGGNNAQRNLVINTYSASNSANAMKALEVPEATGHIAVQVHNYPDWQNESHAKELVDYFVNLLKTNFIDKGTPVIVGEYSTYCTWPEQEYYNTNRKVALYAIDYFLKQVKKEGIGNFFWMGLSDGAYRSLPAFNQADLVETMVKAWHGTTDGFKIPTPDDFQTTYTVKYEQTWAELFLYGDWNNSVILKLNDYKGIRVEMDGDYSEKLQVKVYGDKDGKNDDGSDKFKEQYTPLTAGSNTTTVTFDASKLGSTICRVTLQALTSPQTAKIKNVKLIKSDDTETNGNVSVGWGCTMTSESSPVTSISTINANDNDNNDDTIYNLKGQRVTSPKKGIYIRNGKKFIVK